MTKREYAFDPDRWISFFYLGEFCLGRTLYIDGVEMVAVVTSTSSTGIVPFVHIEDPHYLKFKNRQPTKPFDPYRRIKQQMIKIVPPRDLLGKIINIPIIYS